MCHLECQGLEGHSLSDLISTVQLSDYFSRGFSRFYLVVTDATRDQIRKKMMPYAMVCIIGMVEYIIFLNYLQKCRHTRSL